MNRFLFILFLSGSLFAEEQKYIAVTELEPLAIEPQNATILSNKLRSDLVNTGAFKVIERGEMNKILQEQEFQQTGCTSSECAVEMGQVLGVSHIVSGSISKMDSLYYVNVKLINVATGGIEKSVDEYAKREMTLLLTTVMPKISAQLAGQDTVIQRASISENIKSTPNTDTTTAISNAVSAIKSEPKRNKSGIVVLKVASILTAVGGGVGGYLVNKKIDTKYDEYKGLEKYDQVTFDKYHTDINKSKLTRNILYGLGGTGTALFVTSFAFGKKGN